MNIKVVGTIVVLLMAAVVGLGLTTIHYGGENGKLTQTVNDNKQKIEDQQEVIRDLEGDIDLRDRINTELALEKTNLIGSNQQLLEDNKRLLAQGPRIIETVKVIEKIKYVELEAVEKKVDGYYENLYKAIGGTP